MGLLNRLSRDYIQISSLIRTLRRIKGLKPTGTTTFADVFEAVAEEHADNVAIYYEDRTLTYRELNHAANRYAHWALSQGVKQGDVVALLMENRPEYLVAWLGLVKTGAIVALINHNLQGHALAHSLNISNAKHVVLGGELLDNYATVQDLLDRPLQAWVTGEQAQGMEDLDEALLAQSTEPLPPATRDGMKTSDVALYIYTSGTTGNPKAANISHLRALTMMQAFSAAVNARPRDRMYVVLPLYHSAGGICAVGTMLMAGGALIIRRKFSARNFWEDCHKYDATMFQYIGELCRYLLNAEKHPKERKHKLRVCVGNGLRPEIWPTFQKRFKIPRIIEFYGATEGNVALFNYDGTVGAVGRIPKYLEKQFPVKIVQFDVENEVPVRGSDGFCIECAPGEVGEAIGAITNDPDNPAGRFEGYSDKAATEKKVLRDVFEKGDAYFRTGDLMRRDASGYFYFVDRIGDTFRWKGENVATSEVAEAISVFPDVHEANVYGVHVPNTDGRAGMAAIVSEVDIDPNKLRKHLEKELPDYARPLFLRMQKEIEITGTFKHRKVELVKEGFDPSTISDPMFFDHPDQGAYVLLTKELYDEICAGALRL